MKQIKHKVFNPKIQTLQSVLDTEPMETHWELLRVIYVNEFEAVAVFDISGLPPPQNN